MCFPQLYEAFNPLSEYPKTVKTVTLQRAQISYISLSSSDKQILKYINTAQIKPAQWAQGRFCHHRAKQGRKDSWAWPPEKWEFYSLGSLLGRAALDTTICCQQSLLKWRNKSLLYWRVRKHFYGSQAGLKRCQPHSEFLPTSRVLVMWKRDTCRCVLQHIS